MTKKTFITGGTGFVGAHVTRLAVERGDKVTALVRRRSNISLVAGLRITFADGDITDIDSLLTPVEGCDEVYHVAADYRLWARDPREIYRGNVEGTTNVLEACLRAGVGRVVYTSTVGSLGIPKDGSPGDENTPVTREELVGNYKKSKFDAEQVALSYARRGLDVVIVNPSTPVGPGDIKPTPTGKTILGFLRGKMPAYVDTGLNLIAVEDVAAGHLLAAEKGRTGEKYILGNRNMTFREILEILARIVNRPAPRVKIPHWAAIAAALADAGVSHVLNREPGIPLEGVRMSKKKMFFRSTKALRELGLPQSSVQDALARAVAWFVENGYVGSS